MKHHDIEELMIRKDFEALSAQEKQSVLSQMTVEEYTEQRAVLLAFSDMASEERLPDPDAAILNSLRAKHDEMYGNSSAWTSVMALLFRPIPAYQLAVATGLVFLVSVLWFSNITPQNQLNSGIASAPEVIRDTIELIREVPVEIIKEMPVEVEKLVYVDRPSSTASLPVVTETDDGPFQPIASSVPDREELQRSYGNSGVAVTTLNRLEELTYREGI